MTPIELIAARKACGKTQAEFAAAIGVSRLTVSNWERARFAIPKDLASRLARANLKPAPRKPAKLDVETAQAYREMRSPPNNFSHRDIVELWQRAGFAPSSEAQQLILADWPDILSPTKE